MKSDPFGLPSEAKYVGDYRFVGADRTLRHLLPVGLISWTDWLPGIRFQGNLRKALTQYLNARKATTKKIDCGAEILLNSRTDEEWKVIDKELYAYDFRFPQQSQKPVDDLYAVQGKSKIVWIVSPVAPSMRTCFKTPEKLQAFLKSQSNRKDVFAFSCLDRTEDFPQELFVDHRHLNILGAKRFSLILKGMMTGLD